MPIAVHCWNGEQNQDLTSHWLPGTALSAAIAPQPKVALSVPETRCPTSHKPAYPTPTSKPSLRPGAGAFLHMGVTRYSESRGTHLLPASKAVAGPSFADIHPALEVQSHRVHPVSEPSPPRSLNSTWTSQEIISAYRLAKHNQGSGPCAHAVGSTPGSLSGAT